MIGNTFYIVFVFSGGDWLSLVPFVGTVSLLVYVTVKTVNVYLPPKEGQEKKTLVNLRIQKESPKVANIVDVEDLGDKVAYCRCWRSRKVSLNLIFLSWG